MRKVCLSFCVIANKLLIEKRWSRCGDLWRSRYPRGVNVMVCFWQRAFTSLYVRVNKEITKRYTCTPRKIAKIYRQENHRPLQWRHNDYDGVSNHQPHDCLLNVYSDADHRKHQSSASLAFVRGIRRRPVNSPHKWPVTRKMLPFDDVIMH